MNRFTSVLAVALVGGTLGSVAALAADPVVTPAQIAAAKTPADHEAIAVAYEKEADRLEAMANEHEAMAKSYRTAFTGQKGSSAAAMSAHCLRLQKAYAEAAKETRGMAEEHRAMAAAKPM